MGILKHPLRRLGVEREYIANAPQMLIKGLADESGYVRKKTPFHQQSPPCRRVSAPPGDARRSILCSRALAHDEGVEQCDRAPCRPPPECNGWRELSPRAHLRFGRAFRRRARARSAPSSPPRFVRAEAVLPLPNFPRETVLARRLRGTWRSWARSLAGLR